METKVIMKKHIGVTLVFFKRNKNKFIGIQSSYVFELKPLDLLLNDIDDKAKEITNNFLSGFDFLGISDIYITENLSTYNYLGRTSFFDIKNEDETREFIISDDEIKEKANKNVKSNLINVGFVYFNRDSEGSNFNSTIIIYTVIDKFFGTKELYEVAESNGFKDKIIRFTIENLRQEDLIFKGISDFYFVKNEGLFETEGIFDSKEEITDEILSNNQLEIELNKINNDYKYYTVL